MTSIFPEDEKEELHREWLVEFKRLGVGEYFGELALQAPNCKRKATIKCTRPCVFAVISKENYNLAIRKIQTRAKTEVNNFLQSLPIFKAWRAKHLSDLQLSLQKVKYIRNQVIFREGEKLGFVYLVLSGDFSYTKRVSELHKKDIQV